MCDKYRDAYLVDRFRIGGGATTSKQARSAIIMSTYLHMARAKGQLLYPLLVASLVALAAQPALAAEPEPQAQQRAAWLTGAVYDHSGLPLIGALIAVALPGSEKPEGLTVSNTSGHFSIDLNPGVYTLMAQSFGHISAVISEISVPRAKPLRVQLRSQRQVTSMLSAETPFDIGYALRPQVRDILRQTEPAIVGVDSAPRAAWSYSFDEQSMWANMGGEFSLWTVAPVDGAFEDNRTATDFALGSVGTGRRGGWIFRGQVADGGVVRAHTEMSRALSDSHALRIGMGFAGKDLGVATDSEQTPRNMWVGSIAAEDIWRFGEAVQVGYGLHLEHYNYLEGTALVSPRLQVAYAPVESVTLTTGVSYDAEAPGLAELRFQVDRLAVSYMDVLSIDNIDPERTMHYEVGIETGFANTIWRARVYHDQTRDELVGVYLANASGSSDYFVANVGDSVTRGFEVDIRQSFMGSVSAVAKYTYGSREGGRVPTNVAVDHGLVSDEYNDNAAAVGVIHEVAAGIETIIGSYDTRLNAIYHWKTGVPVVRRGNLESVYERLDMNVRQPLPFQVFSSNWSALLQVQNVLGRAYEGVFDFRLDNVPVLARLVSGGLAVRF